MSTQTRRQREFLAREKLFLDTARTLLRSEGVANLTMDRIAEFTEYAKGTVYKHFTCKEDILCGLCLESLQHLASLFEHAMKLEGNSRVRMMAMGAAYQMFTQKFPEEFDLIIASRTNSIRQKVAPQRVELLDHAEQAVHNLMRAIVNDAINSKALQPPPHIQTDEICFGLWAMSFGILALDQAQEAINELRLPPVQIVLLNQMTLMLDGYGWAPLSCEFDYRNTFLHILQHMDAYA